MVEARGFPISIEDVLETLKVFSFQFGIYCLSFDSTLRFILPPSLVISVICIQSTYNAPHITVTWLVWPPHYYGQFCLARKNGPSCSDRKGPLMQRYPLFRPRDTF